MTEVLGISAFYHDSAATLVVDGEIVGEALSHQPKYRPWLAPKRLEDKSGQWLNWKHACQSLGLP